jgi:predicted nucleic acid-binding protein
MAAYTNGRGERQEGLGNLHAHGELSFAYRGHARYPNSAGTPAAVAELLASLRALPGHEFWADEVTLLDQERVDRSRLLDSARVTDSYLLALAVARGGQLATFDQRLVTDAVIHGAKTLHLIR